ncbi:hypothetical protein FACS1894219_11220 [Clostridia bacterium]|nr:hypothetical protein FACS1894219_11220 [Clostridia bacterium]
MADKDKKKESGHVHDENCHHDENHSDAEVEIYTLAEDDGKESDFELIGRIEIDDDEYVALIPYEKDADPEAEIPDLAEYVILKVSIEDGLEVFITIDDDDEFDRIADIFDEELMKQLEEENKKESPVEEET